MDIGEVARRSGVAPSALRFYEEKGLIRSAGRRGLRRQYDASVLEQLASITLGRAAGLALEEIGRMLHGEGRARVDRAVLAARADLLDEQIRKLRSIRNGLRHAAVCPAADHLECPTFRRLMGLAVARAARKPGRGLREPARQPAAAAGSKPPARAGGLRHRTRC